MTPFYLGFSGVLVGSLTTIITLAIALKPESAQRTRAANKLMTELKAIYEAKASYGLDTYSDKERNYN